MYKLLRKFLFTLPPELAHQCALKGLAFADSIGLSRIFPKVPDDPITFMGIPFKNRIGLSAGFDRNAEYLSALAKLNFGFIEVGTIVPKPQPGNPFPRIFRLDSHEALINRVGFASKGVAYVIDQLQKTKYKGTLGINIGKNKETPNEKAIEDYLLLFRALWKYASYFTLNFSSPNTEGLRALLEPESVRPLLQTLKKEQAIILSHAKKYVPLVIKISPDLSSQQLMQLAKVLLQEKIDGVISANTTVSREAVQGSPFAKESGGLSGRPLSIPNVQMITTLRALLGNEITIIASGGITDEKTASNAFKAGANLLQLYTGLIYEGPGLIRRLVSF